MKDESIIRSFLNDYGFLRALERPSQSFPSRIIRLLL